MMQVIKVCPLLLIAFLTACGEPPVYEAYRAVPDQGWYRDSVLNFEVEISDTAVPYRVEWYMRHNSDYPYSNIYLFRQVRSEQGVEYTDTADFTLADPYGRWLGKGVGELKTMRWPFKEQYLFFNRPGVYTFTLQQAMRTDYLQGIEDVGLGVYRAEETEK